MGCGNASPANQTLYPPRARRTGLARGQQRTVAAPRRQQQRQLQPACLARVDIRAGRGLEGRRVLARPVVTGAATAAVIGRGGRPEVELEAAALAAWRVLAVGDRVDVWRVPERGVQVDDTAALLVAGVAVAELPTVDSGFAGGTSAGSVVVVVDDADLGRDDLADVTAQMLAASAAGQVALTLDPTPR